MGVDSGKPVINMNPLYRFAMQTAGGIPVVDQNPFLEGMGLMGPQMAGAGPSVFSQPFTNTPQVGQVANPGANMQIGERVDKLGQYVDPKRKDTGTENTEQGTSKSYNWIDPSAGIYATAGLGMIASALENNDFETDRLNQQRGLSDATYKPFQNSAARGDWEANTGMFRPDQHTSTQFKSRQMEDGGLVKFAGGGMLPTLLNESIALPALDASMLSMENPYAEKPAAKETLLTPYNADKAVSSLSIIPNPKASVSEKAVNAFNYYVDEKGVDPKIAAAIVGNLAIESGFADDVVSGKRRGDAGKATGLAQWHPDRFQGLVTWAQRQGVDPYSMKAQMDYVLVEAQQRGDLDRTAKGTDASNAAYIFGKKFERPNDKFAKWADRMGIAEKVYKTRFEDGGEMFATAFTNDPKKPFVPKIDTVAPYSNATLPSPTFNWDPRFGKNPDMSLMTDDEQFEHMLAIVKQREAEKDKIDRAAWVEKTKNYSRSGGRLTPMINKYGGETLYDHLLPSPTNFVTYK
jgi:hypothetical protein